MADGPFATKGSDKRPSLAEMAARAAQRSSRPPPAPNTPPSSRAPGRVANRPSYTPPQSYAQSSTIAPPMGAVEEGSGLINLHDIARMRTLAPAVRTIEPQPVTTTPASSPVQSRPQSGGSRYVLGGVLVALVGIGLAYGLNSQNGSRSPSESAAVAHTNAAQLAPAAVAPAQLAPLEAPVAAVPSPAPAAQNPAVVPAATKGMIAPSQATEITAAVASRPGAKGTKTTRSKAPGTSSIAAVAKEPKEAKEAKEAPGQPSAGAAAIAAAMAAEIGATPAAAAPPPPAAVAAAPAAAPPTHAQAKAEVPAPEPTGLAGAIKKAVGPSEAPAPQPVAAAPVAAPAPRGDVPDLPAQGAIQGAMGAQRAAARNCLQGQEAPSRATIVFASSGAVQSVSVSGPAAGTPAEACMKTAMSKMVLGPFRRPTFSFSTTISPP